MRYFKLTDGRLAEYSGPQMGAAWYAANRWLPYAGTLGVDWLYVDAAGTIVELSAEEYAALHPVDTVTRYDALRLKRELDMIGMWDTVKSALDAAGAADDLYLSGGVIRSDDPVFLAMIEQLQPAIEENNVDLVEMLSKCEI